ncbi:hypothetical protein Lal_00002260 [Lupinus albus]|uniref:Glycosyltransferases n=1 Tax=Lupinus albus TaxID=3870 RepID=A0A6A4PQL2_LUPAL|nr:putative 1,4-beta-D-xylan synthase [Lupinus albus]KAF1893740.1 hypothetical protein Lal_00002260 [Lupinus albus]
MASFRRTLSPAYHDRHHHNGVVSISSPSHKLFSPKYTSPLPALFTRVAGAFSKRYARKSKWRKTLFRCFLFFFVGFLLGIFPFGHVAVDEDINIKPPPRATTTTANIIKAQFPPQDVAAFTIDPLSLTVENHNSEAVTNFRFDFVPRKQLIVVTPTYNRAFQAYFLNRLGQVLRLVPPPVLWIVVEMNPASTKTAELLRKTGVMYRHLVCTKNSTDVKDRGVHQRNTALEHIENHRLNGIVYFADDDNIYSLPLFETMRHISGFGTWPVAMLAPSKNKAILEGPVCNGSQVIGWHTNERSKKLRRFHVDMSGFAFNSTILWDPKTWRRPTSNPIRQLDTVKEGFQETTFIEQLVEDESHMEGSPPGCSSIMNWHLHLDSHNEVYPKGWLLPKNLDAVIPAK